MIDFLKYKWLYFLISALVLVPGMVSLVLYGLKPSIDFTGGSELELRIVGQAPSVEALQAELPQEITVASIEAVENNIVIKTSPIDRVMAEEIEVKVASMSGQAGEVRFETVGPTLGRELLIKTLYAVGMAAVVILLYVMYRFKNLKYGVCAILAMFHDSLILVGIFSLLGHFYGVEVDTLFVTAVLTVLSFSVHDTIVVYDRIREMVKKNIRSDYESVVNGAITETLSRSINNSMTIIFMLLALWLMGGETTRWFVFALLVGTIAGTYSSTFTAAPLLVIWDKLFSKKK